MRDTQNMWLQTAKLGGQNLKYWRHVNFLVAADSQMCLSGHCSVMMALRGPGHRTASQTNAKLIEAMPDTIPTSGVSVHRDKFYWDPCFTDGKTRGQESSFTHCHLQPDLQLSDLHSVHAVASACTWGLGSLDALSSTSDMFLALLCFGIEITDSEISARDPLTRTLSAKPQGQLKVIMEMQHPQSRARDGDIRVHL